jgi:Arm DNA-binding domain
VLHRNPRICGANPVPTVKLSDLTVAKLKSSEKHTDYFDLTLAGFGVRVSPKGTKTFILKLRSGRQALGRYPILSLSDEVNMQKAICVFDPEDAIIVAEIDASKASGVTCIHITDIWSLCSHTRTRPGVLPNSGIRTSIEVGV